jgi:hypothetical protein
MIPLLLACLLNPCLFANTLEDTINGTWCTQDKGSFIQREGLGNVTQLKKEAICHTYKVTYSYNNTGVGKMFETYMDKDLRHIGISQGFAVGNPFIVSQDVGLFTFSLQSDGSVHLYHVDASDNTTTVLQLSHNRKHLSGAYLEVGDASTTNPREGFAGYLSLKKTKSLDKNFDNTWNSIDKLTHQE